MNKLLVGLLVSALAIAVGVFAYLYLLGGNRSDAPAPVSQPPATQQPKQAAQNQPPAPAPGPVAAPPPAAPQPPPANPLPPGLLGMDSNGDGAVDLAEFLTFRMRVFDALDVNKDGFLVKDEFIKLAEPPYVPADSAANPWKRSIRWRNPLFVLQ